MSTGVNADPLFGDLRLQGLLEIRQAHRNVLKNTERTGRFGLPVHLVQCRSGNICLHFCDEVFSQSSNRRIRVEKPAAKYSDSKFLPPEEDAFAPAFTNPVVDWLCPKNQFSGGES